nr:lycopene cyclase family protein [Halosimplex rubrum]
MPAYDVAVAGGGPAGLQFARSVASRSEHSVVVLEANDSLADNNKSTGGTFDEAIRQFDIPERPRAWPSRRATRPVASPFPHTSSISRVCSRSSARKPSHTAPKSGPEPECPGRSRKAGG